MESEELNEIIRGNGGSRYRIRYAVPSVNTYHVVVATPSHHTEGEAKWSANEKYLTYRSHKHGIERQEARLHHYTEREGGRHRSSSAIWVSHPTMTKATQIAIETTHSEEGGSGSVELDIFPESEHKMTGTITTTKLA